MAVLVIAFALVPSAFTFNAATVALFITENVIALMMTPAFALVPGTFAFDATTVAFFITENVVAPMVMIAFTLVPGTFAFDAATTAFFITENVIALMMMPTFAAMMIVMMMVAMCAGVVLESAFDKSLCRIIRRALNSGIGNNIDFRECSPSHFTYASADHHVRFCCLKEAGKCAMTDSVRVNDLLINDLAIFDVVKLELFCLSEVLEYISVLISYCNPHCFVSFRFYLLVDVYRLILAAAADD